MLFGPASGAGTCSTKAEPFRTKTCFIAKFVPVCCEAASRICGPPVAKVRPKFYQQDTGLQAYGQTPTKY
jgi:uncharacterized membrane protein YcgQ (UPF0703/DUF1980 family)